MKIKVDMKLESWVKDMIKASSGQQLLKAVQAGGHVIEAYAKINANKNFSGASLQSAGLAGSIIVQEDEVTATKASVNIGPTVVYGRIQELGGTIKPVHAKLLHWVDKGGQHIFAKQVTIPPRPYLRPAVDEHEREIRWAMSYWIIDQAGKSGK